uniref:Cilia and flagella associated protein 54 n=1 Tax=Cynoglossus semilaevis TaxID=244447 RepID=A0A3P8VER8_CYNSE
IKTLVDIWGKYKHRLPSKLYQERMLQVADFLFGIKLYEVALWQGYSVHLQQYTSVQITEVSSVDHFRTCFFPGGITCVCVCVCVCVHDVLTQDTLCKLLRVLNFIRITMQAFQQHERLCWILYNGSLHIYTICRHLMTKNCSSQALEYLLWASISLELSIPLMTVDNLSWIVTLYCAVCQCYYRTQASAQGEEFARRALGKIKELANLEEQSGVPTTRGTQRAFKEASIKARHVPCETRFNPSLVFVHLDTVPVLTGFLSQVSWPRSPTEHLLVALFDNSAAQFLGILEALWDRTKTPDDAEQQEVILELMSAGVSILSGL